MSKKKNDTRELILSKALEMFNDQGIEYVGLRELASNLHIRVSNISYYFPTKDDLVNQLALNLNHLNSAIMVDERNLSVMSFLEMLQSIFQNQMKYRSIMLSIVHLMKQNKVISERHKITQMKRNEVLENNVHSLVSNGYLRMEDDDAAFLASTIALIARFWISEAAISFKLLNPEEQIRHSISLIAHLIAPYATAKGKKQIKVYLNQ